MVRELPCTSCLASPPSEAHHFMRGGGGMGRKPNDCFTVPLCSRCHRFWHDRAYLPRFDRDPFDVATARSQALMYKAEAELLAAALYALKALGYADDPDVF